MTAPTPFDTADFNRITAGDLLRWSAAAIVIATTVASGAVAMQHWTPVAATQVAPEPAMLIDLAPLPAPEPEPIIEPPPQLPPPEVEPPPAEPTVVEPPPIVPEPQPIVEPSPPVVEPPIAPPTEPVVEPEPVTEPEPLPEPLPEAEPVPEEPTVSDVAMPVMMSPRLRQQREQTPATPRPQRNSAPRKPVAEPPAQQQPPRPQVQPAPSQPPSQAAAPTISPDQWQSQVLRRMDQRKVYPRAAREQGQSGAVVVTFTVDADGRVTSAGIGRSSGVATLDQAAIETARRASPLPRPPEGFAGQALSATIRFTLR